MHGSELIEYCQKVSFFQTKQNDVVFIRIKSFHIAVLCKGYFIVHVFGNAPICASTVLECSCCGIHRYVAAPFRYLLSFLLRVPDDIWQILSNLLNRLALTELSRVLGCSFAVDVYCGWCGPCTAMEQHLRKLKVAHITSQDRYKHSRGNVEWTKYLKRHHTLNVVFSGV
jgi:hypothetical protein